MVMDLADYTIKILNVDDHVKGKLAKLCSELKKESHRTPTKPRRA